MADPAAPPSAPAADTTRVFLSYSRKYSAIKQRLADALLAHPEYEPDYDNADHDPHNVKPVSRLVRSGGSALKR
jgi:hypothetical protein